MKLIAKITDEDIDMDIVDYENPQIRKAARGIVLNKNGEIALLHKKNKNEYKLPGGGMEEDETKELAFKREILEETGCQIEITEYMGYTEEIKSHSNFVQTSYVFISNVISNTNQLHLTQKEMEEGGELVWVIPEVALSLIRESFDNLKGSKYDDIYSTKFIVKRDELILNEYLTNYNN